MENAKLGIGGDEKCPGPAGGTVFVVDDDEEVGRSFRLLLGTLHLDVEAFHCAEDLLDWITHQVPDFVITEVYLPGMSGIELLRELRSRGLRMPVIVMATHADVPLAVEAMRLGALDFVEKPFIDRVVVSRVKRALSREGERAC